MAEVFGEVFEVVLELFSLALTGKSKKKDENKVFVDYSVHEKSNKKTVRSRRNQKKANSVATSTKEKSTSSERYYATEFEQLLAGLKQVQVYCRKNDVQSFTMSKLDQEFVREYMQIAITPQQMDRNTAINYVQKLERLLHKNQTLPTELQSAISEVSRAYKEMELKHIEDTFVVVPTIVETTALNTNLAGNVDKKQLRQAMVWKEILDKPLSLRYNKTV